MSFEALYPGRCFACEESFAEGTPIQRSHSRTGQYEHTVCPELKEPTRPGFLAPKTSTEDMGY